MVRLQDALLKGKREGVTEIAGLGAFYLAGSRRLGGRGYELVWTATILDEREPILLRYQFETLESPRSGTRLYECRHNGLLFLAWLIDGWPNRLAATIGRELLWRGLNRPRNRPSHHNLPRWKCHPWSPSPHDFAPEIIARLGKLLEI